MIKDGTPYYFPDIAQVDAEIIAYWKRRSNEASHPILKARYADAVWDLERSATGGKPAIQMAWIAIDSCVECGHRFMDESVEDRLGRALELALSIRDQNRAKSVIDAMFVVFDKTEHKGTRTIWLHDTLYARKGMELSEEQRQIIIDGLESEMKRVCETDDPVGAVDQLYGWQGITNAFGNQKNLGASFAVMAITADALADFLYQSPL